MLSLAKLSNRLAFKVLPTEKKKDRLPFKKVSRPLDLSAKYSIKNTKKGVLTYFLTEDGKMTVKYLFNNVVEFYVFNHIIVESLSEYDHKEIMDRIESVHELITEVDDDVTNVVDYGFMGELEFVEFYSNEWWNDYAAYYEAYYVDIFESEDTKKMYLENQYDFFDEIAEELNLPSVEGKEVMELMEDFPLEKVLHHTGYYVPTSMRTILLPPESEGDTLESSYFASLIHINGDNCSSHKSEITKEELQAVRFITYHGVHFYGIEIKAIIKYINTVLL